MSSFIEILPEQDLADGEMKQVEVDSHPLLLARVGDAYFAADAHCPHLHGNLTKGSLEGTIVTCPWHGSQFDLTDGSVVRWTEFTGAVKTMVELVRHDRPLRVYETLVENGAVFVGPQKPPPTSD